LENWIVHATVGWRVSNSIGLSMTNELWRRWRLWKTSRYSESGFVLCLSMTSCSE
jgi:hypothetical protein